jgi:hypothetical protein
MTEGQTVVVARAEMATRVYARSTTARSRKWLRGVAICNGVEKSNGVAKCQTTDCESKSGKMREVGGRGEG